MASWITGICGAYGRLGFLLCALLFCRDIRAGEECFLVQEGRRVLVQEGDITQEYAPCSTFKVPLALMGYEEGILTGPETPVWPFEKGYADDKEAWKQPHSPLLWMKNSCVWYSRVLVHHMGQKTFQSWVDRMDYGNHDLSGDKGANNGLERAWLSSSLQISAVGQVRFLQDMLAHRLPVKPETVEKVVSIIPSEALPEGWILHGKTGTGLQQDKNGTRKPDHWHGWYVGWLGKGSRDVVFAAHLGNGTGKEAMAHVRQRLSRMIREGKI